jgi:hypothetical protein
MAARTRAPFTTGAGDDAFSQAGTLVRDIFSDAEEVL